MSSVMNDASFGGRGSRSLACGPAEHVHQVHPMKAVRAASHRGFLAIFRSLDLIKLKPLPLGSGPIKRFLPR